MRDTRLVQTAVIGDEHSEVPVLLPAEPIELDVFRSAHQHDTFWCGLLLGGCGGRLATRLYLDRQCHFSHFPLPSGAPNPCRRPAVGESSADHLYVRAALSRSLLEFGLGARFAFPPPIGSLVDVELEDGNSLRIHMDPAVPPSWAGPGSVILGPGVVPEPDVFARCPYVYRVRCESDGGTRRVWIGTQTLAHATDWIPLSECAWTEEGLITPTAARIQQERGVHLSSPNISGGRPGAGALPESAARFIRGLEAAQRTGTVEHVRRLCDGSDAFLEQLAPGARAEAAHARAEAREWLATHESFQRALFDKLAAAVRDERTWDIRTLLPQVTALTRHGAGAHEERVIAAARAALRQHDHVESRGSTVRQVRGNRTPPPVKWPPPSAPTGKTKQRKNAATEVRQLLRQLEVGGRRLSASELTRLVRALSRAAGAAGDAIGSRDRERVEDWARRARRLRAAEPARSSSPQAPTVASTRGRGKKDKPGVVKLEPLEAAVREVLEQAGAAGSTLTWQELREQLPAGLPPLDRSRQNSILMHIDASRGPDAPLLSALVTGADRDMHPSYPRIAAAAGRALGAGDLAAIAQWAVEVSRFQRPRSR